MEGTKGSLALTAQMFHCLLLFFFTPKAKKEEEEDDIEDLQRWAMEAM